MSSFSFGFNIYLLQGQYVSIFKNFLLIIHDTVIFQLNTPSNFTLTYFHTSLTYNLYHGIAIYVMLYPPVVNTNATEIFSRIRRSVGKLKETSENSNAV